MMRRSTQRQPGVTAGTSRQTMRRAVIKAIIASAASSLAAGGKSAATAPGRGSVLMAQLTPRIERAPTLLTAPIELAGDWGHMLPQAADQVVERMRHACLDDIRLVSDRQPTRIRIDEHASGPPAI